MTRFIAILITGCALGSVGFSADSARRFPIGEKLSYKMYWGVLPCGRTTITCEAVERDGASLIRVRATAKSNWLVSRLYPVDDVVECYIEPDSELSIDLVKHTDEGGFVCKDALSFDRVNNIAWWHSESANISTNYPINEGACDAVSFLYALRESAFREDESRDFLLAVDHAQHEITVTAEDSAVQKTEAFGKVNCRRFATVAKRPDLFVRKIPEEIWVTDDNRRIMVKMIARVPVGKVRIVLDDYQPPLGS